MAEESNHDEAPPVAPPAPQLLSDRGQPLVAVPPEGRRPRGQPRKPKPAPPETEEYRSLDDVVRKHVARAVEAERALSRAPDVHTPDAELPPDESDPARRKKMTVGPIALTPDAYDPEAPFPPERRQPGYETPDLSDDTLRTLEDLIARFDLDGSGQFYIMVTRQKPPHYNSVLTQGRMRNITFPLTHEEFCEYYGGGQYQLIVYGPPARGGLIDPFTGKPKPKALSKPVTVIVPWQGEGGREPNPHAAQEHEGGEGRLPATDLQSALINRRSNTLADAKMLETATQKELIMDDRARQERKEDLRERRSQEATAVSVVKETKDEQIQMLQEQLREAKEEARQKPNGHNSGAEVADAMARVIASVQPRQAGDDELQRMKASYEERIRNLGEAHQSRIKDIDERHRRELEDKERVLTREKEDGIKRAEEVARFANQQLAQREQQLIADRDREREDARKERERAHIDHQREVDLLKKDQERDLARQKEHYENLLAMERNTNQRDREMLKESLGTKGELLKSTAESELRMANNEVARLRAETERLKTDLEKKGNLPKQIKEFSEAAEGMGFVRDDGGRGEEDTDWKTTLLRAGATVAEKLPEIIENAGKVVAMTRGAQQQQQPGGRPPVQPGMPPPGAPRALPQQMGPHAYPVTHVPPMWATEDSAPPTTPLPDFQPSALPAPAPQPQPQPPQPAYAMPLPAPPVQPTAAPPSVNEAPPPVAARPPGPSAPPAAAPPPPAVAAIQVSEADILRFAPTLEAWLVDGKVPPEKYAEQVLQADPHIRLIAPGLTPEAVAAVLQKNGHGLSPLVRRDGQRFLRRFRDFILGAPP